MVNSSLFNSPDVQRLISRLNPKDYNEFSINVQKDLYESIRFIEDNANRFYKFGEDALTLVIVGVLEGKNYNVSHDTNNRGHADILLKVGEFKWICEAKIYTSYIWLHKGVRQILHRYSTGRNEEKTSSLIVYLPNKAIKDVMNNWREKIHEYSKEKKSRLDLVSIDNDLDDKLQFCSKHTHEITQNEYTIIHMPVILHFNPSDSKKK